MNKNLTKFITMLLCLFISLNMQAQDITVKGKVITSDGEGGLPGASVFVKGSQGSGTVTDLDGNYTIKAAGDATLVFSFIGFETMEQNVANRSEINVTLKSDIQSLSEVVVIGYGTQEKEDLTGAVGTVDAKEIDQYPVSNVSSAMQGRVSGVQVTNSSSPGGSIRVQIRGVGSITGRTDPLYVVDGVFMTELNNINPADVESLSVLKDASAAAIYGVEAANGVVIITTKKGKAGETKFEFNSEFGVQEPQRLYNVMNTEDYFAYANTLFSTPTNPGGTDINIRRNLWVLDETDVNTNWSEEVFQPATMQRHNFAASGGGENGNYRVSLGYFNQDGMQISTGYERINMNINTNVSRGRFKFGQSLNAFRSESINPNGPGTSPFVMQTIPHMPVFNDSTLNGYGIPSKELSGDVNTGNPVLSMTLNTRTRKELGANGNIFGEVELLEGLSIRTSLNFRANLGNNVNSNPRIEQGTAFTSSAVPSYGETESQYTEWLWDNTITYDKRIGKHKFTILAGSTWRDRQSRFLFVSAVGVEPGISTVQGEDVNFGNGINQHRNQSLLSRVIYSYDDKYLFTGSIRRDVSSKFINNKTGFFPSFSAGWRISDEPFMQNISQISNVKLRVGYGALGRDLQVNDIVEAVLNPFGRYAFPGGTNNQGFLVANSPSPDLQWETVNQTNIGLDMGFFQERVQLTADYFIKQSEQMLLEVEQTRSRGTGTDDQVGKTLRNIGSMENSGLELSLSYRNYDNELGYSIRGNYTYVNNVVQQVNEISGQAVAITNSVGSQQVQRIIPNESIWHFYGFVTDGLISVEDMTTYGNTVDGEFVPFQDEAQPGDVKYVDLNNDGTINDLDRRVLGNSIPQNVFGLTFDASFRGFDFNILLEGKSGFQVYNQSLTTLEKTNGKENRSANLINNTWTAETPNTDHPRIKANAESFDFSDRQLQNGAYASIRNIQIGYDLKSAFFNTDAISRFRIYVGASNLFILTDYEGYNPDVWDTGGSSGSGIEFSSRARPTPRIYTTGIQVNF